MKPVAATLGWFFGPGSPPRGPASHQETFLGAGLKMTVSLGCLWGWGGHPKGAQEPPRDCWTRADHEVGLIFCLAEEIRFSECAHSRGERPILADAACRARANHDVGLEH